MHERHAVIIGGGISGLSTAFFLSRKASQAHLPLRITVVEASDRFGGALRTLSREGSNMEAGADAFYAGRSDAADLCRALGLEGEMVEAAPCFRRFFFLKKRKLLFVPSLSGSFAGALHFFNSPLLNFFEKLRMLCEPFIPRRKEEGDESLTGFFRRRLGQGFCQKIAEPLIRGVYMADPKKMSLKAMFPRLGEAERTRGSLAGFFLDKKKNRPAGFLTLRSGLEGMTHTFVGELRGCELRRSTPVRKCIYDNGWKIVLDHGGILLADTVCLAMNACDAAGLLLTAAPELSRALFAIRYDAIARVNLIYRSEDVPDESPDFGFLVPAPGEHYPFSSLKWIGRIGDGKKLLLRAFISETMLPEVFHEKDEMLKERIRSFLREFFSIESVPQLIDIERYPDALPLYETGHLERVEQIEKTVGECPGLYLTGNGFHGFGITDCVHNACQTADRIFHDSQRPVVASSYK